MRKIMCALGFHNFLPMQVFKTQIVKDFESMQHLRWECNYLGKQCVCGKRWLEKIGSAPSVGERQQAYDWLHDVKPKAQILKLIKK